jgi:hypothetical protein
MANTFKFGNGKWAVKDGYALAYNDENGNFKPLPFDFTRSTSATRVNKDGLIEVVTNNKPRIDFLNDSNGALLLELQRTNLITESALFSGYSGNNEVITDNSTTSPDGTLTGAIFADDNAGGTGTVQIFKTVTVDVSSTYTWSIFAKKKDLNFISLRISNFTTPINGNSYFDLNLGTVVSAGSGQVAEIENYGNGWYRCSVTFTTDAADTSGTLQLRLSKNGTTTTVDLDNTSNIYIWGWQFEKSNHASSYIPTSGSAVTVVADECSQTVPDGIFGANEVSFVIDFEINGDSPSFSNIFNTNKNITSSFGVTRNDSNDLLEPFLFDSGINVGSMTSTTSFLNGVRGKFAVGYKSGDSVLVVQGNVEDTNSGTFSNINVDEIHLNDLVAFFGYNSNVKINDFKLYNTRLSNAELQALTQG